MWSGKLNNLARTWRVNTLLRQTCMTGERVPSTSVSRYNARTFASATSDASSLRNRLTSELKSAMKSRDKFSSTVLRSVIAEVYAAEKTAGKFVSDAQVASILKKAIIRRTDSATQYTAASRVELAAAEEREAEYIASLLPPSTPDDQIENLLKKALQDLQSSGANLQDVKRSLGLLLKTFYQEVDRAIVDGQVVKKKAEDLLANAKP